MDLLHDEVVYLFNYINGCLYWKNKPNKYLNDKLIGTKIGNRLTKGYGRVLINGKLIYTHRLVWLYFNKSIPKYIDHVNGIRDDNRIENLRETTIRKNGQNRIEHRNGKLVGCWYNKLTQKWQASIKINKKSIHLGCYITELEAHNAYLEALKQLI